MELNSKNNSNSLELRAIADISGMEFLIKDYQRGYRWTPEEVKQLLDDLKEFVDSNEGTFYCLQPVVVRKLGENKYEVIDGQQRLTTLNLILQYLSDRAEILHPNFELFRIKYETRENSEEFLSKIKTATNFKEYIDFFFMKSAYQTIVSWFDNIASEIPNNEIIDPKKRANLINTKKNNILNTLLNIDEIKIDDYTEDNARNVRIIWYEIAKDETTSSVDIFTRLNIGRIPLTDAELVKALFLNNSNFSNNDSELRKIQLSEEWNLIEQSLHNDSFWYFLNQSENKIEYSSRIEFIFDILSERTMKSKKYHTFHFFNNEIKKQPTEEIWRKVKKTYQILNEWFNDRELYHIIGYLLENGAKTKELIQKWETLPKSEFRKKYLPKEVKMTLKTGNLRELSYDESKEVRKILLLFNILTILEKDNSDMRFPFDRFKSEKWDIEHVCSQTDLTLEKSGIQPWCLDILEYFNLDAEKIDEEIECRKFDKHTASNLKSVAKLALSSQPDKDEANRLFTLFQKRFDEDKINDKDSISNLALLDAQTNRSYGNAFFPCKRKHIIENDSKGVFVPIATKNLFLKYYTPNVSNMMTWTNEDGEKYIEAIDNTINNYINPKTESNE